MPEGLDSQGGQMTPRKKSRDGRQERLDLLAKELGPEVEEAILIPGLNSPTSKSNCLPIGQKLLYAGR